MQPKIEIDRTLYIARLYEEFITRFPQVEHLTDQHIAEQKSCPTSSHTTNQQRSTAGPLGRKEGEGGRAVN